MTDSLPALSLRALDDLAAVVRALPADAADALIEALATARRIAIYGAGREGLQMRGLAMRLFHLGLDVHVVADMTVPPVGPGDLLFVSSGPGASNIGDALMKVAREAGAQVNEVADRKPFQAAVKPVWDKYGAQYATLIERIQNVK